ncbi:uncharacterized protein [Typha angustifolia]|uniref:uncharacterized protein n=1 Tax=Typha angustifolia TaxID=59011 RepID=UPI003C2D25DA
MEKTTCNLGIVENTTLMNAVSCWSNVGQGAQYNKDVTVQFGSLEYSSLFDPKLRGTNRKWGDWNAIEGFSDPKLALGLGLGLSPSSSDNSKVSSATAYTMYSSTDLGLDFHLYLGHENKHCPTKSTVSKSGLEFDLELSLSTGPSESVVINYTPPKGRHQSSLAPALINSAMTAGEEGSDSSSWVLGSYLASSLYSSKMTADFAYKKIPAISEPGMSISDLSSTACTSRIVNPQQRNTSSRNCQFQGCRKGARGASGLCIAHGGGRRCSKLGCHKGAEGRTIYCKAHGGGRRCQFLGCTRSAEGCTDYCIAHGGGRRCNHDNCTRAARGKSGLCIRHGGGRRCKMENCTKSAECSSGLCIAHGGGKRCEFPACTKGAQGGTKFCKAHGGGKRCTFLGCTKGAEGRTLLCKRHGGGKRCSFQGGGVCPKSVHGGTQFCVRHGGGKRCALPGCTTSARGSTKFCTLHGGGKRCKAKGCSKSAQGSTDYCKAHGGGKRCSWSQPVSNEGNGDPGPCDRIARSKAGLCVVHCASVQDQCVHGAGILRPSVDQVSEGDASLKMSNDGKGFFCQSAFHTNGLVHPPVSIQSSLVSLPERRTHGGSLIETLSGNACLESNKQVDAGALDDVMHSWM